jgi:hypothetical protein
VRDEQSRPRTEDDRFVDICQSLCTGVVGVLPSK